MPAPSLLRLLLVGLLFASACGAESPPPSVTVPLTLETMSLPAGQAGEDYATTITAAGGEGDLRWSIVSGALPSGLFITSEGEPATQLAGRPASAGMYRFALRVQDGGGQEATGAFTLEIRAPAPALAIVTELLPDAFERTPYDALIQAENGSNLSWQVLRGSLPDGLRLESTEEEARILGTPMWPGTYSFQLQVRDGLGRRATRTYRIVVSDVDPTLQLMTMVLPVGLSGQAYEACLQVSGGVAPFSFSLVSGGFASGLELDNDGCVRGTPSQTGSFAFRIEVEDAEMNRARASFFIEVRSAPPPLRIATFTLPPAEVGVAYDAGLSSVNASGPVSWAVVGGALPDGLRLETRSPDARILGMPIAAGTYTFEVQAQDQNMSQTRGFVMEVAPEVLPLEIVGVGSPIVLSEGQSGQSYSAEIRATGGAPNPAGATEARYHYVLSVGSLPPGLTLDPAGQGPQSVGRISGTPDTAGTYEFDITVYDRRNMTASRAFRLVIR